MDALWGEPPARLHPVVWMGRAIAPLRRRQRRGAGPDFALGLVWALGLPACAAALGYAALRALAPWPWLAFGVEVYLLSSCFSLRALLRAGARVERALGQGDLGAARDGLRWLCSRDPAALDATQLAAGSVESLAENHHDSVVAPLLYYALFGLPGALFFRAVNTLDASVGYRGRYEYLGKASARLDDALGWLPARLSTAALWLSARLLGLRPGQGWRRQAAHTASPNAGLPMALVGAAVGVRLEKPGEYVLGPALRPPDAAAIRATRRVVRMAAWGVCATTCAALAARGGGALAG